jgi:hypothetical protein
MIRNKQAKRMRSGVIHKTRNVGAIIAYCMHKDAQLITGQNSKKERGGKTAVVTRNACSRRKRKCVGSGRN